MSVEVGDRAGTREWLGLAVPLLPTALLFLAMTVLFLSTPHIAADLRPSSDQLLWVNDVYGFVMAGLLVAMGTLGDRLGRRRVLLFGAVTFGLASVLAAFAPDAGLLIGARALMGLGAVLAVTVLRRVPPDRDARRGGARREGAGRTTGGRRLTRGVCRDAGCRIPARGRSAAHDDQPPGGAGQGDVPLRR